MTLKPHFPSDYSKRLYARIYASVRFAAHVARQSVPVPRVYQHNAPGISIMGKKTWLPGKTLARFITGVFGIPERKQKEMVERISDAVADTAPAVREKMDTLAGFR